MATYYEQTIPCVFCSGMKRITKADNDPWNYGDWTKYNAEGKDRYICPSCKNILNQLFEEFIKDYEKAPVKKAKKEKKK